MAMAAMAQTTHGVVTRARLLGSGVTDREIEQRLSTGALIRVHRGIYRVGHCAPSVEARYLAAVWACGERAVLSGRAAAYLLGLLKGSPPPPEVTTPTDRRVSGVRTRRSRIAVESTRCRAIPVTTVEAHCAIGCAAASTITAQRTD